MNILKIFKSKSTKVDKSANAVNQLKVYWTGHTWAFDDARVGLVAEPFVAGADLIISETIQCSEYLYTGLEKAKKNGILITFSETPLPHLEGEAYTRLDEAFRKYGHGMYVDFHGGRVGWLCPATLHYFKDYPPQIFVSIKILD